MLMLAVVAALAVGGAVGSLVAWIGVLLNTTLLDDKPCRIVLLVLGLLSFGWSP